MSLLARRFLIHFMRRLPVRLVLIVMPALLTVWPAHAAEPQEGVPLIIGNRTIHVFRAHLGAFSPEERVEAARQRVERAFLQPGEGWTSIKPSNHGIAIELDGKTLFHVVDGDASDARDAASESTEAMANQASRTLQKAWSEARERSRPNVNLVATGKAALATLAWLIAMAVVAKLSGRLRQALFKRLARRMKALSLSHASPLLARMLPTLVSRLILLLAWLVALSLTFITLTYSLTQFVLTRPASEALSSSLAEMSRHAMDAILTSIPGVFVSILIFLMAWITVRILDEVFVNIAARSGEGGWINPHTAPATRRIVMVLVWLFAIAMAYPYLPGSHTEAFKGLSVMLGVMVSIGGAGVIGQIASGVMIVYTYALQKGEYVRIQEYEGVVTELGLFVTRLRTGYGEEIAIPNTVILGNVTRNFSRASGGPGCLLETTVTIGYDTPWRQVHAMLLEAARTVPDILETPSGQVLQTALSDFYVEYKLVVHLPAEAVLRRSGVTSDLNAAIQDTFNRYGVQIMSPHYCLDPKQPKLVAEAERYAPPARRHEV